MVAAKAQQSSPLEEEYNSASDEDFDPSIRDQAADDGSSTSDEGQRSTNYSSKKRRITPAIGDEFDNSGDDATIRKGKRKRRKGEALGNLDDEAGGEGGLVKTRAQRAKEEHERKPIASAANSTVDVDALWASMSAARTTNRDTDTQSSQVGLGSRIPTAASNGQSCNEPISEDKTRQAQIEGTSAVVGSKNSSDHEDMVAIKRTFEFAGETITEEKLVLKDSAEARLYYQSEQNSVPAQPKLPLRRPKKRASMFQPSPIATTSVATTADKGPKLNTIEKSKLDWAGYVDKQGIADDLDEHSRAKDGYLGRMDFLGRVEAKREEDLKSARKK